MMTDAVERALGALLSANPGPVSITAGIATLRAIGSEEPAWDLQSLVGSFAAERGRSIRFDRLAFNGGTMEPPLDKE